MVNVIIKWKKSEQLLSALSDNEQINVVAITDRIITKDVPDNYDGKMVSTYDAIKMYKDSKADKFYITEDFRLDTLENIVNELKDWGVSSEDIIIVLDDYLVEHKKEYLIQWDDYSFLPYLEFHVADHCNLNCKGCVHFSPLVQGEVFTEFENVKKDFMQLKKKFKRIDVIRILGGEPLLNKELNKYIYMVKEVYPRAKVAVVTNGLLLRSISEDIKKALRETNTELDVSLYEPIMETFGEIYSILINEGLSISVSSPIHEFSIALDNKKGHAQYAQYNTCHCPNLYNGKLYVCPIIAYAKYFNEYFAYNLDEKDGAIDIYNDNLNHNIIKKELKKVRNICDNCLYISKEHQQLQKWCQTKEPKITDYMLGDK